MRSVVRPQIHVGFRGVAKVKSGALAPQVFGKLTQEYLDARNLAYSANIDARPKRVYALHLCRDGPMLDCFVHEGKHQDIKDIGGFVHEPQRLEKGVKRCQD